MHGIKGEKRSVFILASEGSGGLHAPSLWNNGPGSEYYHPGEWVYTSTGAIPSELGIRVINNPIETSFSFLSLLLI
jgi:hypothetical protein